MLFIVVDIVDFVWLSGQTIHFSRFYPQNVFFCIRFITTHFILFYFAKKYCLTHINLFDALYYILTNKPVTFLQIDRPHFNKTMWQHLFKLIDGPILCFSNDINIKIVLQRNLYLSHYVFHVFQSSRLHYRTLTVLCRASTIRRCCFNNCLWLVLHRENNHFTTFPLDVPGNVFNSAYIRI